MENGVSQHRILRESCGADGVHPYGELQSRILGVDEHHDFCQDFGFEADSIDGKVVDISTQRSILASRRWL